MEHNTFQASRFVYEMLSFTRFISMLFSNDEQTYLSADFSEKKEANEKKLSFEYL